MVNRKISNLKEVAKFVRKSQRKQLEYEIYDFEILKGLVMGRPLRNIAYELKVFPTNQINKRVKEYRDIAKLKISDDMNHTITVDRNKCSKEFYNTVLSVNMWYQESVQYVMAYYLEGNVSYDYFINRMSLGALNKKYHISYAEIKQIISITADRYEDKCSVFREFSKDDLRSFWSN